MSDDPTQNPAENEPPDEDRGSTDPVTQQIQHSQVSALVPEVVARGVFSTGAVVLNGAYEFIIDFLLRMAKPHQVSARVVLPPSVVPRLIGALQQNLDNYTKRFGPPTAPHPQTQTQTQTQPQPQQTEIGSQVVVSPLHTPDPPSQDHVQQTSAQELYEQLKISDDELCGTYANAVMIGHTATEFSFDFITTFFPRSVVSKRVYLAAPNVPRLLDSLKHSYDQYQRKAPPTRPTPPSESPF